MPNLQDKTNEQLMTLLHNIMRHSNEDRARIAKEKLYTEWHKRNKAFTSGRATSVMAAEGVLSAFRYHVGDGGVTDDKKRQQILDHVLEAPIPPIVSEDYTKKWGAPNSHARKKTLLRTLHGFISGVNHRGEYSRDRLGRAKSHWQQDIAYVTALAM